MSNCGTRNFTSFRNQARRGFSLTEFVIVLGVAALLIGGIWQVAETVNENSKREQMLEQMTMIVNNVRATFGGRANASGLTTDKMIEAQIVPSEMIRDRSASPLVADTPWGRLGPDGTVISGGSFELSPTGMSVASPGQYFFVGIRGLALGACVELATKLSGAGGPPGLVNIQINEDTPTAPTLGQNYLSRCKANVDVSLGMRLFLQYRLRISL